MLKIWGRTNSINVQKVMWAVGELGRPHERIDVGGAFGGLDGAEYRALNANGRIPTIQDDGVVVWESNACVRYLAARYDTGGLWPEDPVVRAGADMWMDWQQTTLLTDMTTVFWGLVRTSEAERDYPAIENAAGRLGSFWRRLDDHLAKRRFVAGERFTMGDIPVGATCYRYYQLAIERPKLAALEAWYGRLQERAPYRTHVMLPLT
jgi:glutathione S-transferase